MEEKGNKGDVETILRDNYIIRESTSIAETVFRHTYETEHYRLGKMQFVLREPVYSFQPTTLSVYMQKDICGFPTTENILLQEIKSVFGNPTFSNVPASGTLEYGGYEYQFNGSGDLVGYKENGENERNVKIISMR